MRHNISISDHAVDRWLERVDGGASRAEARLAMLAFANRGTVSETPRWWMRRVPEPGDRYIYCATRRGICLVMARDGVVVTVYRHTQGPRRRGHLWLMAQPAALRTREIPHPRWRLGGASTLTDFGDDDLVA